jgi:hypothetical protein
MGRHPTFPCKAMNPAGPGRRGGGPVAVLRSCGFVPRGVLGSFWRAWQVDAQAFIAVAFPVPARAPERAGDRGAAIQKVLALRQACLISASSGTGRKPRARR